MLYRLKMRIVSEIMGMRISFCLSFFIVLCCFIAGFICAGQLEEHTSAAVSAFMFGKKAAVFSVFFSLFWKRALSFALCCFAGLYAVLFPLCVLFLLFFELTFCLSWGCMLTGFMRSAAILPFIIIPMVAFLFCTTRSLAHIFNGYAAQIRERRIPKTCADIAGRSLETVKVFVSSLAVIACMGAVEAIVAAIAL